MLWDRLTFRTKKYQQIDSDLRLIFQVCLLTLKSDKKNILQICWFRRSCPIKSAPGYTFTYPPNLLHNKYVVPISLWVCKRALWVQIPDQTIWNRFARPEPWITGLSFYVPLEGFKLSNCLDKGLDIGRLKYMTIFCTVNVFLVGPLKWPNIPSWMVLPKVIIEKSRGEGSLMEQDTIENVS